MSHKAAEDDAWDQDWDDGRDESDDDLVECPHCGHQIYDDVIRCPYCENYLSDEDDDQPRPRKPWWLLLGVAACLYVVYRWIFG